ncbi:hypothetical protein D3C76_858240 [compost metagenome]
MLPTHQRLDRNDLKGFQAVARLVVQNELVVFQRLAQVVFQLAAVLDLLVHFRREVAPGVLALGLGLVQGDIGAADQFTRIETLQARLRHTQAGADMQGLLFEVDRLVQAVDQAPAKAVDLVAAVHAVHYQHEFVATQACHQVAVAGRFAQACGHFQQHGVASGVAEGIVDRLEAVQVEQQQGQRRGFLALEQRVIEEARELVAVGQARQRIVHRQVLYACVGSHFIGNVAGGAAITGQFAVEHDRARRNPAKPYLATLIAIGAAQVGNLRRVGVGLVIQPLDQRRGLATEQLVERLAQPVFALKAGNRDKTLGQVAQAVMTVGFPDPVRRRFGHRTKPLLAGLQRLIAGLKATQVGVDFS